MSDPADAWNGIDRRAPTPIDPDTLQALIRTHEAIADVAVAMHDLGEALVESQAKQNRGFKIWMGLVSAATTVALILVSVVLWFAIANFPRIDRVLSCVEVGGECFELIEEREDRDADRRAGSTTTTTPG